MKAGHTSVTHLADLREVVERERVESGVLLTLQEPTQPIRTEAASSGWYASPWSTKPPWIQIRTLKELLVGIGIDYTRPGHGDHQEGPKGEVPLSTTEGLPFFEESQVMETEIPAKVRGKSVKPANTLRAKK